MRVFPAVFTACTLLATPVNAPAQEMTPERLTGTDWSSAANALARAEIVVTLVRSEREIRTTEGTATSDLRVSLVVLDAGSSTDVSPRHEVHLAMFNDVNEHGQAWGIEPIAWVHYFKEFERTAPGIYEVYARTLNTAGTFGGCPFTLSQFTIDARNFSVAVRQAKGLEFGEQRRYRAPVTVTEKQVGCD